MPTAAMHEYDGRERTRPVGDVGVESEADSPGPGEFDIGLEAGDSRAAYGDTIVVWR